MLKPAQRRIIAPPCFTQKAREIRRNYNYRFLNSLLPGRFAF
jgi:hypothetical protein